MTANSPPYAMQAGSHSAQLFRQAISTLLAAPGGVVGASDYAVTQNGSPNMSVNVAGGAPGAGGGIWVPGSTLAGVQGLYYGYNDAAVNLAISASNPTNPRIDVPIAQVQDAAYAGATSSFQLAVVTGTPAASPAVPSIPASSYALANVAVAANATTVVNANITDKRSQAALGMNPSHSSLGGGGSVIIPTSQNTASTSYTLLGTPDQVAGVVMSTNSLLMVAYQATVGVNANAAVSVAIFLNGVQLVYQAGLSTPTVQEANTTLASGRNAVVSSGVNGMVLSSPLSSAGADATSGQVLTSGAIGSGAYQISGGPVAIFAAAGTYTVDVRYKTASGTLTVSGRRLYAWVERF